MNIPLSGTQLIQLFNKHNITINIVERDEVEYKDILNIRYSPLVLLYETVENIGHWVIVYYNKGYINFFDSYGIFLDGELKYTFYDINKIHNLKYMLQKVYKNKIRYNKYQIQNFNSSTCGRHVFVRYLFKNITNRNYYNLIFKLSKTINRNMDDTVYNMSNFL